MSVLIKDMEMPESCEDCPFHVYHSHYQYVCKATPMFYPMNLANSKGIRKDWCPLIKMPPHGDLIESSLTQKPLDTISRQAAIDEAEEWIDAVYCDHDEQRERDAIRHVINGIKELPSAQPEIIRCRDCAWHNIKINQCNRQICAVMYEDDFCSHAERRTDESD